ncbi:hypothetical protein DWW20_19720 [Ruminococcus sp. AF14-5]|nr:hypothetical protein DWW20_19720 [Ruminococcus sp. AF14-5]
MVFKRKKNIFKNVLFSFLFVILDITAKKLPDNTGRILACKNFKLHRIQGLLDIYQIGQVESCKFA